MFNFDTFSKLNIFVYITLTIWSNTILIHSTLGPFPQSFVFIPNKDIKHTVYKPNCVIFFQFYCLKYDVCHSTTKILI